MILPSVVEFFLDARITFPIIIPIIRFHHFDNKLVTFFRFRQAPMYIHDNILNYPIEEKQLGLPFIPRMCAILNTKTVVLCLKSQIISFLGPVQLLRHRVVYMAHARVTCLRTVPTMAQEMCHKCSWHIFQ